jgi:hypothetical protein
MKTKPMVQNAMVQWNKKYQLFAGERKELAKSKFYQ